MIEKKNGKTKTEKERRGRESQTDRKEENIMWPRTCLGEGVVERKVCQTVSAARTRTHLRAPRLKIPDPALGADRQRREKPWCV